MRRTIPKQDLENGQDSFLDVVSNIVGILIILVVIVGAQVKNGLTSSGIREFQDHQTLQDHQTSQIPQAENEALSAASGTDLEVETDLDLQAEVANLAKEAEENRRQSEDEAPSQPDSRSKSASETLALQSELNSAAEALAETVAAEQRLEEEIVQLRSQRKRMDAEQLVFADETIQLEARLRLIQKEMESRTSEEDLKNQEQLRLAQVSVQMDQQMEEVRAKIQTLVEQQARNGGPKKIEHKMTPIVHSVDSRELHFILDEGRVLYVPLEELTREYELKIQGMMPSLLQNGVRKEVLGPYDGFRLETETRLKPSGQVSVYWQLVPPPIEEAGETVEVAFGPASKFRHYLEKLNPEKDILTFWIYPDGFTAFGTLKEAVYRLGFSIASRPLPAGTPIAGSPEGQRSMAQ